MIAFLRAPPSPPAERPSPPLPEPRAERHALTAIGLDPLANRAGTLAARATAFAAWCARCHARAVQRRQLADLDERMLEDIGLTKAEAARESAKPWWRA